MARINLFATRLTDNVTAFLETYQDGLLRPLIASRMLDQAFLQDIRDLHPHQWVPSDDTEEAYIVLDIAEPLEKQDIDWLYQAIIAGRFEYNSKTITRRCVERVLTPPGSPRPKTKVDSEEDWPKVNAFKRKLAVPALALKHLKKTFDFEKAKIAIDYHDSIMVIRYIAIDEEQLGNPQEPSII